MSDPTARLLELARNVVAAGARSRGRRGRGQRARRLRAQRARAPRQARARRRGRPSQRLAAGDPRPARGHHGDERPQRSRASSAASPTRSSSSSSREPDPFAGPADPSELAKPPYPDLDLFDPDVGAIDADEAIRARDARRARRARFRSAHHAQRGRDVRAHRRRERARPVERFRGGAARLVRVALGRSGRRGRGRQEAARPLLDGAAPRRRARGSGGVGREAARRTLAQARRDARSRPARRRSCSIPTWRARSSAASPAASWAARSGASRATCSSAKAPRSRAPLVTIVDDPLIPRAPGSRPFDGEGLPSRQNRVVENGVLRTFLCDSYSARKLGPRARPHRPARSGGSIGPAPRTSSWRPARRRRRRSSQARRAVSTSPR